MIFIYFSQRERHKWRAHSAHIWLGTEPRDTSAPTRQKKRLGQVKVKPVCSLRVLGRRPTL